VSSTFCNRSLPVHILLLALYISWLSSSRLLPADQAKPLTAEQKEKLTERDRLTSQADEAGRVGKVAEELQLVKQILAINRSVLGDDHNDTVFILQRLTLIHALRGEAEEGQASGKEGLERANRTYGDKHWKTFNMNERLQDVDRLVRLTAEQRDELVKARALVMQLLLEKDNLVGRGKAKQSLDIRRPILGDHPDTAYSSYLKTFARISPRE
jgi:hypothetical protein